jgi:hypothetical protein
MKTTIQTPKECKFCGAGRQIHGGHGGQHRRFGWFHYECGTRWHHEHGWSYRTPSCDLCVCEAQRDRLVEILDTIAGIKKPSPMTARAMRDLAKVGVVEMIRAKGREYIDRIRDRYVKEATT